MKKKPTPSTKTALRRRPAKSAPPVFKPEETHQPMMAELYRRAEARLSQRRRSQKPESRSQKSEVGSQRSEADTQSLVHELQVHQVELEMQNTELQAARDAGEVALEKYTDLYDFAPVGYFSLDEESRILEVNLTGAALLGLDRSQLLHQRLTRFVALSGRPVLLRFLKHIFSRPERQVCEVELLQVNGTAFWASVQGTSAISGSSSQKWCRVTVSDITSRKQVEELLRRNEALFSALIQQVPVGVYVVDGLLRLQQVNPKARLGFHNIQPLIGRDLSEILHILRPAQIATEILGRFRHTLLTGKPYISPEYTAPRQDNGVIETYEWQLQRITLPTGELGIVCFFNDITERKEAEEAHRRIAVLAASNQKLEQEIVRRRAVEEALQQSQKHQAELLDQSRHMHAQLRQLAHQVLKAQEEERKRISRELHDQVTQTLVGINVHLEALARQATINPQQLTQSIAGTQRLVEKSVDIVHQFARDLRPTALDDLGLVAALHTFMTDFLKRTGIRVHFTTFTSGQIEELSNVTRTVFYRVAQEALSNVARHAQATQVDLSLQKLPGALLMQIKDNGKSFNVERVLDVKRNKRLGLLGMRERVEMVGGQFTIQSAPVHGTTIRVQIPFGNASARGGGGADGTFSTKR